MTALLALCSSLLWGTGDFLGGRASRTWGVLCVLAWSQAATLALMWLVVAVAAGAGALDVGARTVLLGALGGCAGVIGLAAFYRALAIGPMSVVPPIAAAGVVVPVAIGLATGAPPTPVVLLGLAVAVVGVVLASMGEGSSGHDDVAMASDDRPAAPATRIAPRTLALCFVAACGFAFIFVALDAAAGESPRTAVVATAGVRLGSFLTLAVATIALRAHPWQGVAPGDAARFAAIGVLDTGANLLFAIAAALGRLEVVAVLGSLYPAVTSALAHVVLHERLGRVQLVGVAFAVVGVMLLAGR